MSTRTIIPDKSSGRHRGHPEADQFALDDIDIPAPGAPELTDASVKAIGEIAEAWRKDHGMTHTDFIARFRPYVANERGWHLIRNVPLSEWGAGRGLVRAGVVGLLAALKDEDAAGSFNPLVDNEHTLRFAKSLALLRRQRGGLRCVFILGPTSSGKTSALDLAANRLADGRRIIRIQGREAWKSPREMLSDWGAALGVDTMKPSVAAMQTQIRDALRSLRDALVFVDEGHSFTGAEINMVRDWVNDMAADPGNSIHFVIAAIDTLWSKLSDTAREEADQLRINRCLDVIHLTPPGVEEINTLFTAGCRIASQLTAEQYAELLNYVEDRARTAGSRAYIRDVRAVFATHRTLTLKAAKEIADSVAAKNRLQRKK